jgi:hypothetical protein
MLLKPEAIRKKRSAHTATSVAVQPSYPIPLPTYAFKGLVKHLNWETYKPQRGGIIPYMVSSEGNLKFALGLDYVHKELTDFGGGISYKKDGDAVVGSIREFDEESLGVFGEVKKEDLENCLTIYSNEMMIIFLKVDVNASEINKLFYQKLKQESEPEVCDIVWLEKKELKKSLEPSSRLVYVRVRYLLSKAEDFYSYLIEDSPQKHKIVK